MTTGKHSDRVSSCSSDQETVPAVPSKGVQRSQQSQRVQPLPRRAELKQGTSCVIGISASPRSHHDHRSQWSKALIRRHFDSDFSVDDNLI